ncbi:MAG TPA: sigma-70 family RNA polymerase sigma factor [Candidatus Ozemobacteraceae bacterium]|nr:sigma-70 family RNA polymerase sigma factor [Candidatus Ozemobacteraceae bacterium]
MENANAPDSRQIVALYASDPRRGFDLLYRLFANRVATYLRRSFNLEPDEISDIVHDTFLPWVENPDKMKTVENPASYLFSTAKYIAMEIKHRKRKTVSEADAPCPLSDFDSTKIETGMAIADALSRLPEEQRETVALKIWGDLTFEEIAAVQQVSLQTAASRYRYALQKLKEILAWTE